MTPMLALYRKAVVLRNPERCARVAAHAAVLALRLSVSLYRS